MLINQINYLAKDIANKVQSRRLSGDKKIFRQMINEEIQKMNKKNICMETNYELDFASNNEIIYKPIGTIIGGEKNE